MRLLPKSEINKAKALDRQREIEEGKKLATKVDTLREVAVEEEQNLEQFRVKTVKAITEEINLLTQKRDTLVGDIKKATEELAILTEPLDREWEEVRVGKAFVAQKELELAELNDTLQERRTELENAERELEVDKDRVKDLRITANENVARSVTMVSEANKVLAQAREQANALLSNANVKMQEIERKEVRINAKEREVQLKEASNAKVRRQNIEDSIALADERLTLERGFAELKQKQNGIRRNSTKG